MSITLCPDALTLIKSYEGDPPSPHPEWPGEQSGITIGYGVDLGMDPGALDAWRDYLSPQDYARLDAVKGITGAAAQGLLPSVEDIPIGRDASAAIFAAVTAPRYLALTLKGFPGAEALPPESLGALVSLVFNRGTSTTGKNRSEMAAIKAALAAGPGPWPGIILEIARMTAYWNNGQPNKGATNLAGRRLAEASFFARGLRAIGRLEGALIKGDRGDRTSRIAALQTALKVGADGDFGPGTMIAVWSYQKSNAALQGTGVADAPTLSALGV
ncbi:MAG: peptidoglycan-binding protein [Rhodospirillaceae bacterium]